MADRNQVKVCFSTDFIAPEDFGHFIEHPDFTEPWKAAGFTDDDFCAVQAIALLDAANTDPIPNTGGLRCREFSVGEQSIRFWYMYFPESSTVYFALAQTEELDEHMTDEDKTLLRERATEIELELEKPRTI